MQTKPHGHGDVHMLLHSTGLADRWAAEVGAWMGWHPKLGCMPVPLDLWLLFVHFHFFHPIHSTPQGFKWVCFFQDTNGLVFRGLPAAIGKPGMGLHRVDGVPPSLGRPTVGDRLWHGLLWSKKSSPPWPALPSGVSAVHDYDVNSLAVPRKAKEAIGAITRLKCADGRSITINVEYNQLDPLLRWAGYDPHQHPASCHRRVYSLAFEGSCLPPCRATINPEGDVNDKAGFSPLPGQQGWWLCCCHC